MIKIVVVATIWLFVMTLYIKNVKVLRDRMFEEIVYIIIFGVIGLLIFTFLWNTSRLMKV